MMSAMKTMCAARSGFTLVELMVVAVIVAILAAVAVPMMGVNRKRAMATEAESALGTVRGAMRAMYAETRDYSRSFTGSAVGPGAVTVIPGVGPVDLEGQYFRTDNYEIESVGVTTFVLRCSGSTGHVAGVTLRIDQDGTITRSGL
jgi:prepilin-type N-terminal cleavage/methylation domain-containing protein